MNTTIRKIGNSEGIIIPKDVLEDMHLSAGDSVALVRDGNDLHVKPIQEDADEFERKMKIARERMKKYEVALRELAK